MRTRTAAGLLALSLLGMPLLAACSDGASIEVTRRDDDDDDTTTTEEPPETDPPETDPPETDPPETDPPETDPPTRSTISVPPPPTPGPNPVPPPTDAPVTDPPVTATPAPDPTSTTGTLPPIDQLVTLIPNSPPGAIDFDKSTDACDVEGLCILTLVVNNGDYNAVAAYYEAEFPNMGVALDGVTNDGALWSANFTAPGVTGFAFIESSTEFPGFTDVLLSFFPA